MQQKESSNSVLYENIAILILLLLSASHTCDILSTARSSSLAAATDVTRLFMSLICTATACLWSINITNNVATIGECQLCIIWHDWPVAYSLLLAPTSCRLLFHVIILANRPFLSLAWFASLSFLWPQCKTTMRPFESVTGIIFLSGSMQIDSASYQLYIIP